MEKKKTRCAFCNKITNEGNKLCKECDNNLT